MKSVCFICPANVETGGTECIFECASTLIKLGLDATIAMIEQSNNLEMQCTTDIESVPERFRHYSVPIVDISSDYAGLVVFPETFIPLIPATTYRYVGIWWLSVDNIVTKLVVRKNLYEMYKQISHTHSVNRVAKGKNILHFVQSHYAYKFCLKYTKTPFYLRDSVATVPASNTERKNTLVYNPRRGSEYVGPVIKELGEYYDVSPIIGLPHSEVLQRISESKICLDLGHQPGRDKLPREAAGAGCVVILSNQGAAQNAVDFPIDSKYKVDVKSSDFVDYTVNLVHHVVEDYSNHWNAQSLFRRLVHNGANEHFGDCIQFVSIINSLCG